MADLMIEARRPHQALRQGPGPRRPDARRPDRRRVAMLGPNGAGKSTFVRMVATLTAPDAGSLPSPASTSCATPSGCADDRAGRPVGRRRGGDDRPREPGDGRPAVRLPSATSRRRADDGAGAAAASRRPRTGWCGPTRAGCAGGSTSAPASSASPACCCSTSRPPGSTPAAASSCGTPIRALVAGGTDVLLTTQYLDEADHLADSIVIIDDGRVIAEGTPGRAQGRCRARRHRAPIRAIAARPTPWPPRSPPSPGHRPTSTPTPAACSVPVDDGTRGLADAVRALDDAGVAVDDIGPAPPHPRRGLPRPHRDHRPTTQEAAA